MEKDDLPLLPPDLQVRLFFILFFVCVYWGAIKVWIMSFLPVSSLYHCFLVSRRWYLSFPPPPPKHSIIWNRNKLRENVIWEASFKRTFSTYEDASDSHRFLDGKISSVR